MYDLAYLHLFLDHSHRWALSLEVLVHLLYLPWWEASVLHPAFLTLTQGHVILLKSESFNVAREPNPQFLVNLHSDAVKGCDTSK